MQINYRKTSLLTTYFLLPLAALFAQPTLTAQLTTYADANFAAKNFNGNILIAQKGKILFQKSYGYADLRKKTALDQNSIFNICSVTKEFTAAAVLLCRERGLLSLDDSLRKFFPELPFPGVTIKQMLTHTSGIVSSEFLFKEWSLEREMNAKDLVDLLTDAKPALLFKPGEKFAYSNTAYVLLSLIIEKVSGVTYRQFLKLNIFDKLQMNNTALMLPAERVDKAVENYIYDFVDDNAKAKTYFLAGERADWNKAAYISTLPGSGNIYSTTADLLKWQEGLNSFRVISQQSLQEMTSPKVTAAFAGMDAYGYGIAINAAYGDTMLFHNGGTLGYSSTLRHFKNQDLTIITLANTSRNNDPVEALTAILSGKPVILPSANIPVKLSPAQSVVFTGTYQVMGRKFKIELKNDSLFRTAAGTDAVPLIPKSASRLFYGDGSDRDILFEEKDGKTNWFILKADGMVVEMRKEL